MNAYLKDLSKYRRMAFFFVKNLFSFQRYGHFSIMCPRGVLLGIFGGGVPPASPNPDPISDQKSHFPHPFSDLAS